MTHALDPRPRPSSGQLGAAAEIFSATRLVLDSGGRLSAFTPLVDDDAIDVTLLDKRMHASVGLQIKSWSFLSEDRPQTVQFDVRRATWREDRRLLLLAVAIDAMTGRLEAAWLVPSDEVAAIANVRDQNMSLTPSAKPESQDRYSAYRHHDMDSVAAAVIAHMDKL